MGSTVHGSHPLFTIGHSTHEFPNFLDLLKQHQIEVVADVRSRPVSRFPWFCQEALQPALLANGIRYVFLGTELGARREELNCYIGSRADYGRIARTPAYQKGIDRLRKGVMSYRVALMCSEREPLDCHRTILVCRSAKEFAEIFHIWADGRLESHEEAEQRLLSRYFSDEKDIEDMFRKEAEKIEIAYKRRGEEINYVDERQTAVLREESPNDEY